MMDVDLDGVPRCGLENRDGANHCFLNVVVQALWNLESFRGRVLAAPALENLPAETAAAAHARICPSLDSQVLEHEEEGEEVCIAALRSLLAQYASSEAGALPPDVLRECLSDVYGAERGRFRLGEMADATETIEALLDCFHASRVAPTKRPGAAAYGRVAALLEGSACDGGAFKGLETNGVPATGSGPSESLPGLLDGEDSPSSASAPAATSTTSHHAPWRRMSDAERIEVASNFGCHPECVGHEVFGIEYVDIRRCSFCNGTGEPAVASSFLYRVYVAELLEAPAALRPAAPPPSRAAPAAAAGAPAHASQAAAQVGLAQRLWELCQHEAEGKCHECSSLRTTFTERWLTRRPLACTLSLVWPLGAPSREDLWRLISMVQPELEMERIFRMGGVAAPHEWEEDVTAVVYTLRGLICYKGLHYTALFWCLSRKKWLYYDDDCVREESSWSSVTDFIVNSQYVPTLVFYEHLPSGAPGGAPGGAEGGAGGAAGPWAESVAELRKQVSEAVDPRSGCTLA